MSGSTEATENTLTETTTSAGSPGPQTGESGGGEPSPPGSAGATPQKETGAPPSGESGASPSPSAKPNGHDNTPPPWASKRIDQLTGLWREEERRRQALEQELATYRGQSQTPPPSPGTAAGGSEPAPPGPSGQGLPNLTSAQIEQRAAQLARERQFTDDCNRVYEAGTKQFSDFDSVLKNYANIGGLQPSVVEAAMETEAPQHVIYELAKNLNEAQRISALPPVRQAAAVAKFAAKLEASSGRQTSSAPAPIRPAVGGAARAEPSLDNPETSVEDWMRLRNEGIAKRRQKVA